MINVIVKDIRVTKKGNKYAKFRFTRKMGLIKNILMSAWTFASDDAEVDASFEITQEQFDELKFVKATNDKGEFWTF